MSAIKLFRLSLTHIVHHDTIKDPDHSPLIHSYIASLDEGPKKEEKKKKLYTTTSSLIPAHTHAHAPASSSIPRIPTT